MTGSTANWTAARWASSGTTYGGNWSLGADTTFADGLSFTFGRPVPVTGGTASLGNLTTGTGVTIGFTTGGVGQPLEFGAATRTFTIGPDSVVNFGTITLQNSASPNGLIKEGAWTLVMGGGTSPGGLTLGGPTTRTLTVGTITGSGTSGVRFGSGTGLLTGTVTLTGSASYAGSTTIDSSTLSMSR